MIIRKIRVSDLDIVSHQHSGEIESLASKLGPSYLRDLYALLVKNPQLHFCLVAEEKGKIIGALTATKSFHESHKIVKKIHNFPLMLIVLKKLLLGKLSLAEIYKRFMFEYLLEKKFEPPYATILTVYVISEFQNRGIGKRLVENVCRRFRDHDYIHVDTLIKNSKARNFYRHLGFKECDRIIDSVIFRKKP